MEIIVGNELLSGAAVYFAPSGEWVEDMQRARLFASNEAAARDEAIAKSKATLRIVGIEIEKVAVADGKILPERLREIIRSTGSTTPVYDRQHLDEDGHVSI